MKKTIQRSKVCVIGKLVRKLRDVKRKQDKQPNVGALKLAGRTVKLTEQIEYLKRTGNVELATACLLNTRPPQNIVTNPMSTGAELALANLCSFKVVADKCAAVKDRLNLSDTDDKWRQMIREIGKKKQRKIKKETLLKRKADVRSEKDLQRKRSAWLEENIDVDELKLLRGSKVEPMVEAAEEIVKKIAAKPKKAPEKKSTPAENRVAKKIEIIPAAAPTLKMDSFFMTSSGTGYMATAAVERLQPAGPNDSLARRERRDQQFGRAKKRTNDHRRTPPAAMNRSFESKRPAAKVEAALHPSWVAKQKTKGIEQFAGTKIKFGDTVSLPRLTVQEAVPAADAAKLHPSWVAKQKLKPTISEFKGKKITFD